MKLIIFLLLLSANCLGQYTSDTLRPRHLQRNLAPRYIEVTTKCIGSGFVPCPHKWVELHQDTVEKSAFVKMPAPGFVFPIYKDEIIISDVEFVESIPLICLICHQEKKKVIHYKRN